MKKRLFITLAVLALSLASCGNKKNNSNNDEFSSVTLTDQAGRTVTIDEEPKRIVSAYYISTTICLSLGLEDKLVGIEKKASSRDLYKKVAPELLNLPGLSTKKEINVEETLNCNPDLVILPKSLSASAKSFDAVGVNVVVVNPESEELIKETYTLIGKATNTSKKAESYINYKQNKLNDIENKLKSATTTPKVYLSSNSDFLSTTTSKMYQDSFISYAHAENVSHELTDDYWATISNETILAYNPDYILCTYGAEYIDDVLKNSLYSDITAIKNNNVIQIPSEDYDIPSSISIVGIMWLSYKLHSDLYTSQDYYQDAQEFYNEFFGIDINEDFLTY